jgi:hypothetical protein
VTAFKPPADGLVRVKIDPFTGFPATSDKNAVNEWFIAGTEPQAKLPTDTCGIDVVGAVKVETPYDTWMKADSDWLRRAERGPGVAGGPNHTRTAYFYNPVFHPYGSSWGVLVGGSCGPQPSPTCYLVPTPDPNGVIPSFVAPTPDASGVVAQPCPPVVPSETPSAAPSQEVTPPPSEPPPTATPEPSKPSKPPKPTPPPAATPTPAPPEPTPTPVPPAP